MISKFLRRGLQMVFGGGGPRGLSAIGFSEVFAGLDSLLLVIVREPLAERLPKLLWQAYGKPIKFAFWCIVIGGGALLLVGFIKKLVR